MSTKRPIWSPDRHRDRRPWLTTRAALAAALRAWFAERGFVEIDPDALQVSPGNETHLHGLAVKVDDADDRPGMRYLHTSPEFAMKKLLAAGETAIFSLGHVYRARDRSALHAIEFTMLEWYRVGQTFFAAMDDTVDLIRQTMVAAGADELRRHERTASPAAPPERLTVADAFGRLAGIDLGAVGDNRDDFAAAAADAGVQVAADDDWSDIFSRVLVERVEPHLGDGRLTLLHDYPPSEAALARLRPGSPPVAERFEVYACGVELANGFAELTDARVQRERFTAAMDKHERVYGERFPVDDDFLAALCTMPEACGVALGFDRLVMLATGAPTIHHVMWTPEPGALDRPW